MNAITHSKLVKCAAKWLRMKGCAVVITEMACCMEEPDAIGWKGVRCIVIEAKASRGDFKADAKKGLDPNSRRRMGHERYYIAAPGMIKAEELPPGWGLLEVTPRSKVYVRHRAVNMDSNRTEELRLMVSALRRIGNCARDLRGVSVRPYTFNTKNRATLGIMED